VIFQEALRIVILQRLPDVSQHDILAAVRAGRPGPLDLLYEAGTEAGLSSEEIVARGVAIYFNFCAGNLSDDLSDDDCGYLEDASRIGPCTQFILQNLFFYTLLEAGLPNKAISSAIGELIAGAGPQHIELRTRQWDASRFREVAEGIAGRQWSAYLQILWCGTRLASRAASIGMNAGIVAHTVKDIKSDDPRYTTMRKEDKREILNWALSAVRLLHAEDLRCVDALLLSVEPALKAAQE
jgi:hypothetical protein